MRTIAILMLLAALPAQAQEQVVSPGEFREYAEGWTLYFEQDGLPFGSEEFEADGKTRWRYPDGTCTRGAWRAHGAQLCFLYEEGGNGDALCWRVLRDENGLLARLLNSDNEGMELRVTGRDRKPLLCGGPGEKA